MMSDAEIVELAIRRIAASLDRHHILRYQLERLADTIAEILRDRKEFKKE